MLPNDGGFGRERFFKNLGVHKLVSQATLGGRVPTFVPSTATPVR